MFKIIKLILFLVFVVLAVLLVGVGLMFLVKINFIIVYNVLF